MLVRDDCLSTEISQATNLAFILDHRSEVDVPRCFPERPIEACSIIKVHGNYTLYFWSLISQWSNLYHMSKN